MKGRAQQAAAITLILLLAGRWLMAVRIIWLILVILAIMLWIIGTIEHSIRIPVICLGSTCDPFALSAGDLTVLAGLNLPVRFITGFFVASNIGIALAFFTIGGPLPGVNRPIGWACWSRSPSFTSAPRSSRTAMMLSGGLIPHLEQP